MNPLASPIKLDLGGTAPGAGTPSISSMITGDGTTALNNPAASTSTDGANNPPGPTPLGDTPPPPSANPAAPKQPEIDDQTAANVAQWAAQDEDELKRRQSVASLFS